MTHAVVCIGKKGKNHPHWVSIWQFSLKNALGPNEQRLNINRSRQCCGSGMFIPDPRSQISDPGFKNSNKREGWKKICYHTFCSHKFHKINKLFYFWNAEENNLSQFSKNYRTFDPKFVNKSQKYGFGIRDPRSGIRDPKKIYSGSRIQGSKRHRIPDPESGSSTLDRGGYLEVRVSPADCGLWHPEHGQVRPDTDRGDPYHAGCLCYHYRDVLVYILPYLNTMKRQV